MVSKTAGTLMQLKAAAPNYNTTHILHHYIIAVKIKMISFNNSQPLGTCLFIIVCDKMLSMHTAYT